MPPLAMNAELKERTAGQVAATAAAV